ncbi:trypsin-like peptidase domain-containing protein [Candidatus Chloroploca sp. M-50]|uniref:Trypsin-like peptidase domain-containing protein n=2 Tax=Candidatus Chloroploca mongolica TaxID=2528176 RepID=A0ABS4D8V7_9CHLR|nr:trypsin-like peptidase domain-containing protein [Candidatus Chloroploca mongolica]
MLIGIEAATLAAQARASVVQVQGRRRGAGSGVVWRDSKTVMTNFHVIAGVGERVELVAADDRRYRASLIAGNPRLDLALLAVEESLLPPVVVGDSTHLRVGELVFAVGNPWGMRGIVTAGIVSAVGEIPAEQGEQAASYIRSDVRLAPGNSGGPLLNARGEVVGINAMIFGGDLAVAIPSHVAQAWAASLPRRPVFLGLAVQPAVGGENNQIQGLLVAAVANNGPAAAGGLQVGDLLQRFDDQPLPNTEALLAALQVRTPGDTVRIEGLRGGQPLTTAIRLAAQAAQATP